MSENGPGESKASGKWEARLAETGALIRGHFLLSSGLHSPAYVQCARYLEDPRRARLAGQALAERLTRRLGEGAFDSVLAPAMGALLIGHEVAAALGVPFRFTERSGGEMTLRRGFTLGDGERLVLVEDAVTTGRSTLETAEVARQAGAEVVAVASIVDRTGNARPFGETPFESLLQLDLPTFETVDCPMCADGQAAVKPGSRPGG